MKELWTRYKGTLAALGAIALLYGLLFAVGVTCPIKFLFGISCPGCGMTRAWLHALTLDLGGAFAMHPLWPLIPPLAVALLICGRRGQRRTCYALVAVFILLMLAVYSIRLFTPGEVVVCRPTEGFLYRTAARLLGW